MLYTETDIEKSMSKIETVNFHQEMDVNGIRFWCYTAGHVLGAAMFMIEIAGVKVTKSKSTVWPMKNISRQFNNCIWTLSVPTLFNSMLLAAEG